MKIDTMAYSLGKFDELKMSSESVLDAHYAHAKAHQGRVLFTVADIKFGNNVVIDDIKSVILVSLAAKKGLIGQVRLSGKFPDSIPEMKELPSQWDYYDEYSQGYTWFELVNVESLDEAQLNEYVNVNGDNKSLLRSLLGANSKIYVTKR